MTLAQSALIMIPLLAAVPSMASAQPKSKACTPDININSFDAGSKNARVGLTFSDESNPNNSISLGLVIQNADQLNEADTKRRTRKLAKDLFSGISTEQLTHSYIHLGGNLYQISAGASGNLNSLTINLSMPPQGELSNDKFLNAMIEKGADKLKKISECLTDAD